MTTLSSPLPFVFLPLFFSLIVPAILLNMLRKFGFSFFFSTVLFLFLHLSLVRLNHLHMTQKSLLRFTTQTLMVTVYWFLIVSGTFTETFSKPKRDDCNLSLQALSILGNFADSKTFVNLQFTLSK